MTKSIFSQTDRDQAIISIRHAATIGRTKTGRIRRGSLVARKRGYMSRDFGKDAGCVGVAISGGGYEIHASPRFGDIWVYFQGVLRHEEDKSPLAAEVIALAAQIAAGD